MYSELEKPLNTPLSLDTPKGCLAVFLCTLNIFPMKTQKQLLQNVIGQLQGVVKMIENEKDCFQTLTQMKAAKSALNSVMNKFLQENFMKCIDSGEDQKKICGKFFKEILNN